MKTEENLYRELYAELTDYEKRGVDILMDGDLASPLQIVTAYMTRENGTYMRDYVINPQGRIETLAFTKVDGFKQAEITP